MVVVGLGKKTAGIDEQENWHEGKENIRAAVAGSLTLSLLLIKIPKGHFCKIINLSSFLSSYHHYPSHIHTNNSQQILSFPYPACLALL